ncbi:hypothetical protein CBR_g20126 [Chara braunii]|uniref:Myb-like domain-containing protein n=1 Tax=Chara braunii TaxID=69332 RepID=A0A388KZL3_CHABU|nr:hypothetical protein CBR_g20126 [Chara braunii]|eukprot:GBG75495.1 hypothetical protein CBR_g20126 [Chara braunii]
MGSQLYRQPSTPTYTDLLEGRTLVGYDAGLVDLSFGLRSGSGQDVTHTVLVNPASGSNNTAPSVGACGLPDTRGRGSGHSGDEHGLVSRGRGAVGTVGVRTSGTRTGGSTTAVGAVHRERDDDDCYTAEVVGREVWDDYRRQSRQSSTSAITRGVSKINVGADDTPGDCDGAGGEDCSAGNGGNDNDEDDDGEMEIRPVGKKRGGPRATSKSREPRAGRRGKKSAGDASAGDGAKNRDFWTVEHMIALVRAKRDQDLHLAGLGHNMGRMKTKTWKWADIESRLVQIGVTSRKADDCGKKWDNLYMQLRIMHKFMGESGKPDFFTLTPRERKEWGFDCGWTSMCGSDGCGDGQEDDQGSTRNSSFSGGGAGGCGKRKNVRQQTFDTIADVMKEHGSLMAMTVDSASKRQYSILTRQCDILEQELEVQKEHYSPFTRRKHVLFFSWPSSSRLLPTTIAHRPRVPSSTWPSSISMRPTSTCSSVKARKDSGASDRGETQRGKGHVPKSKRQRVEEASSDHTGDFQPEEVLMVDAQGTSAAARLGFGRDGVSKEQLSALKQSIAVGVVGASQRTPKAIGVVITEVRVPRQLPAVAGQGQPRQALPLQQVGASRGGKAQSTQKGNATAIGTRTAAEDYINRSGVAEGAAEERVDDVRRDNGKRDGKWEGDDNDDRPLVTRLKGAAKEDDLEERSKLWVDCDSFWGQGPGKPLSVEKLVLRAIHGWIFKSLSWSAGFARAESYISVDIATDVARAVWQGQEWSNVVTVSPALVYHTLGMKMDVPLWFAGVKIVDRPEDDDMAARQEATVLRVAECWTYALWCGQWADDDRSHYEACLYSSMVAKPTMIAVGLYIFNWRRYIVDSANLVLDRIGKAHLTLGEFPHCIPEWCDCGLVFGHNATLKNVAEAAKHGWIGRGPATEEEGDEDG